MPLTITLVTPERRLANGQAIHQAELPGLDGRFGVLENHTHTLSPLAVGEIRLLAPDGKVARRFAAAGGFVEVSPERVVVTSPAAEPADEIAADRARAAKERAEKRLAAPAPDTDLERAQAALARAANRLRVAQAHAADS